MLNRIVIYLDSLRPSRIQGLESFSYTCRGLAERPWLRTFCSLTFQSRAGATSTTVRKCSL